MTNQPTEPKQPNKRGRQTALTPELQAKLVQVLEAGNYIEAACDYVGLSKTTFFEWLQRGEGSHKTRTENKIYAEFADAIKKARSSAEVSSTARIRQAAIGGKPIATKKITKYAKTGEISQITEETTLQAPNWQADAWWLERSFPNRWGRQRVEITGPDGAPFKVYMGVDIDKV